MRILVLALAAIVAFSGLAQAQTAEAGKNVQLGQDAGNGNAEAGKKVFRKCMACHKVGPKAMTQRAVGPELNGVIGRKAGSVEGYKYSKANKTSGITWTEEVFTQYIKDPRKYLKGTKMAFAGIKDDQDIKDLIAFLKQYKADGTMTK